ncbi:hypothetical protein Fmac_003502 [Flemingia macrophylla]|uniref:Late embryogenesis abundant protein LEA-2 subgroup domain-containing protein n=1 Tax=Flemingia macrophylla TaxID=520843 RepID=A0ABD1NPF5_9FABA
MACCMRCSKGLKICCGVTATLVIILIVVLVVLYFTLFKPKDPDIILQSVKLESYSLEILPALQLNVSLGTVVTVDNPNRGSFTYQNSTAHIYYRGYLVAQAPLHEDTIPARRDHNISTTVTIFVDVQKFHDLPNDYATGVINFTSTTTLVGKVKVLNLFKIKATSYSTCLLSLFFSLHQSIHSNCNSQIKL